MQVAFLGVFDTVAAMDGVHTRGEAISSDVVFENGTLDPRIRRAVHIVSLDEDRVAFEPTLINRDEGNPDRITEIWFPGVHSDIGGGYWHDGLADVSLRFMIEQCKEALGEDINIAESTTAEIGRLLSEQGEILKLLDIDDILVHPNVTGMVHRHTTGSGRLYAKDVRKGLRARRRPGAQPRGVQAARAPLGEGAVRSGCRVPSGGVARRAVRPAAPRRVQAADLGDLRPAGVRGRPGQSAEALGLGT